MILTCPNCATGYFVEDRQVPAGGRQVRCGACKNRWTVFPPPPLDLVTFEEEGAVAKPAPVAAAPPLPPPRSAGEEVSRALRGRAEEEKRLRRAALAGAAWAAGFLVVAMVAVSAILFRGLVVRVWPQAASAYAAIGAPVNATGLAIEAVHAEPALEDGHATLAITGVIRNVAGRDVTVPPLRISLLDAQGRRVAGQVATLANARIASGAERRFSTEIFDPPFSAADLQVEFATGAAAASPERPPPPAMPPATQLRGPAPP